MNDKYANISLENNNGNMNTDKYKISDLMGLEG